MSGTGVKDQILGKKDEPSASSAREIRRVLGALGQKLGSRPDVYFLLYYNKNLICSFTVGYLFALMGCSLSFVGRQVELI